MFGRLFAGRRALLQAEFEKAQKELLIQELVSMLIKTARALPGSEQKLQSEVVAFLDSRDLILKPRPIKKEKA